jgi:hypothetical protein
MAELEAQRKMFEAQRNDFLRQSEMMQQKIEHEK